MDMTAALVCIHMHSVHRLLCVQNTERSKVSGQKISVVNGQTVPPRRAGQSLTRGRSCNYRVYGSDAPGPEALIAGRMRKQH